MSTFAGRMREYSLASLDRFDGPNLESTAYFLSHNHADHTQGLDQKNFQYRLLSNSNYKLYCSAVTKDLLSLDNRYNLIVKNIVALDVDQPHQVPLYDPVTGKVQQTVTVTPLGAQHCPGSVMFLFEGSEGTALYTGDFRLNKSDLQAMTQLHSGASPKTVQSLYADTTFCVPQAMFIPSRDQSTAAVIDLAREWIAQSSTHVLLLRHKATLGYEDLYRQVAQHFSMKVHVSPSVYEQYKRVGDMAAYTTPDPSQTQIHACRGPVSPAAPLPCCRGNPAPCVRRVTVSTMFFLHNVGLDTFAKKFSEESFRVCYSFHSSFTEVRDLVLYLRPERALPNVVPSGEMQDKVQRRLDQFVEVAKNCQLRQATQEYRALGKLKVRKRKQPPPKPSQNDSDFNFGDLGESPAKPKRSRVEPNTTEFPSLHGDAGSDAELDPGQEAEPGTQGAESGSQGAESGSRGAESDAGSVTESVQLTQEDRTQRDSFAPLLPDTYGACLAYLSDAEDDDQSECSEERIDVEQLDGDNLALNGDVSADHSAPGRARIIQALTNSVSFGSSLEISSDRGDSQARLEGAAALELLKSGVQNGHTTNQTSPSGDTPTTATNQRTLDTDLANQAARSQDTPNQAANESGDVIVLEDHDDSSGDDADSEGSITSGSGSEGGEGSGVVASRPANGHTSPVIDLTAGDDDDEDPAPDNIFSRLLGLPGMAGLPGAGLPPAGFPGVYPGSPHVEYYEQEVACSDDECECGGRAEGGTHKYMVPRPKLPAVCWDERDLSDDPDGEGDAAQRRTRRWIHAQYLYMQRQSLLNSQPVSRSDIIVIDTDDSDSDSSANGADTGGGANSGVNSAGGGANSAGGGGNSAGGGANSAGANTTAAGAATPPTSGDTATRPKTQVSPASDRSATMTSCPTNLSLLAQPSESKPPPSEPSNRSDSKPSAPSNKSDSKPSDTTNQESRPANEQTDNVNEAAKAASPHESRS